MRIASLLLALLLLGAPAQGFADQNDERLPDLFEELKAADDPVHAEEIEARIWQIWSRSGNGAVSILMRTGNQALQRRDYAGALIAYEKIVEMEPDFAEGWNKRATVLYLLGDFEGSLSDIRRTLILEPRHFGALSGLGLVYMQLERPDLALESFEEALEQNPHMEGVKQNIEAVKAMLDKSRI